MLGGRNGLCRSAFETEYLGRYLQRCQLCPCECDLRIKRVIIIIIIIDVMNLPTDCFGLYSESRVSIGYQHHQLERSTSRLMAPINVMSCSRTNLDGFV